jgi:hypothetical protein
MHRSRYIALALIALLVAVALPAAAIAQSAGEDQYTDPLQGGGSGSTGGGGSGGGGSSGGSGGGGGGNAPAQPASTQSDDPTPAQAAPAQADDSDGGGLPRTGFPVAVLVGAGLILLSGGLALRRPA